MVRPFTQPYGILSGGNSVPKDQVHSILVSAIEKKIETLDSALGYGDIISLISGYLLSHFQIITKFSVLEDRKDILQKFNLYKKNNEIPSFFMVY